MLRKILIFIPMIFGLLRSSLAFLSPDIISGILGIFADNAARRGAISGDFGAMFVKDTASAFDGKITVSKDGTIIRLPVDSGAIIYENGLW